MKDFPTDCCDNPDYQLKHTSIIKDDIKRNYTTAIYHCQTCQDAFYRHAAPPQTIEDITNEG